MSRNAGNGYEFALRDTQMQGSEPTPMNRSGVRFALICVIPARLKLLYYSCMDIFDPKKLAEKWNTKWREARIYQSDLMAGQATDTYYNLMMFPYPSAEGLHVGNMYAFTGSDIWGRYQRMQGKTVFEPIGLDGFGIHSENFAIKIGRHPKEHAKVTQENFYRQLSEIGNGFAWENRLETYDPEYYRWTQWIFIQLFKAGLAYRKKAPVNWCPGCKTVLADEQVIDGLCERCSSQVEDRDLEQWFFRITKYADRLLDNLEKIDWDNKVKVAQKNWIGRKEGIEITYKIEGMDETVTVFTTTPVNFGATFLVVAPEHELVGDILEGKFGEVREVGEIGEYIKKAAQKTEQERVAEGKEKTGVFTGLYAINHVTGEKIPVWVSDFVLAKVGTGAIQGCPGHDLRDWQFAKKFGIPIKRVVMGPDGDTSEVDNEEKIIESGMPGTMINSDFLNGMEFKDAMVKTMDHFEKKGWGKRVKTYHLRDWLISRQRYWGPPIPMLFCEKCDWQPVPEKDLPVVLPDLEDFKPTGDGKAPLERASKEWFEVKCPECGAAARRETDVSDTFLDSAWYFLRYPSIGMENGKLKMDNEQEEKNLSIPWDREVTLRWLPVDMYIGGAEHSVLHLLYARFVTMFFYDQELLQFEEPFTKFRAHGLIIKDGVKMSKSKGNVVNPDEYIAKFGADTLRTYLMFVGPLKDGGDFRDTGIAGMYRFLERVWNTYSESRITNHESGGQELKYIGETTTPELKRKLHWAIKRATEGMERLKYNTSIAAVMELLNEWRDGKTMSQADAGLVLRLMAPFAPYLTEELWQKINGKLIIDNGKWTREESIHLQEWPTWEEALLVEETVSIVVQVNGKVRGTLQIDNGKLIIDNDEKEITRMATEDAKVKPWIEGKEIKKVVWVPGKVINLVTDEINTNKYQFPINTNDQLQTKQEEKMETEQLANKFVAVLNRKVPMGNLMNALAHMSAGLAGSYPDVPAMRFDTYTDKDGNDHKSISDHPFVILAADNSNQVRTLRQAAIDAGVHFVDFTSTMTVGTYVEQKERTKQTPEAELEYWGICMFGDRVKVSELTKKFSLWK